MLKNITKTVLTSGVFMAMIANSIPLYANEKNIGELETVVSYAKTNYNDEESFKEVIQKSFKEDLSDIKIKSKTKDSIKAESDKYVVVVNGITLEKTGIQNVKMTLTTKTTKKALPIELPVTAKQLEANTEPKNKTVMLEVKDETAPIIEAKNTYTTDQGVALNLEKEIKANDEVSENVDLKITGDVDYDKIGTYTVSVNATDESGNKTSKEITVNVEENFYDKIASAALAQVGAYQDCTMLVTNALRAVGINFHGAPESYLSLGKVTNNPVPGDIIVYSGHVALYIGNGKAVHGGWLGNQTVVSTVECSNPFIAYVHVSR